MKKLYLIITLLMLQGSFAFAQIAINSDGSAPHQSAGLDISYPDKGLLIPRLSFDQRNAIQNPAEGLIIYCTNCNPDGKGVLCIYEGTSWKTLDFRCDLPNIPVQGVLVSSINQITWDWDEVPIAVGYKWNSTNDFATATDLGPLTSYTESNLICNHTYTRYIWAYNQCGFSTPLMLQFATQQIPIAGAPPAGVHSSTLTTISWHWNTVSGATGYKWNTTNDYNTAIDKGTSTTTTETNLNCGTQYTRYVWGYNECGATTPTSLIHSTTNQASASPVAALHTPSSYEITWKWHPVAEAGGYKWSTTNNYATAVPMGSDTSYTESNLDCFTTFTRYIWAFNNCGVSPATVLTATTDHDTHPSPAPAINYPLSHQVEWNWHPLENDHFSEYRWNTVENFNSAIDLLTDTTYTETGLGCNTSYTRYIWAYDNCAISSPITISAVTALDPPINPVEAVHSPSATQIVWQWNVVSGVTGYKWNTSNDYGTAQDVGLNTSYTETGLTCNTGYTRFVWAYNNCGVSATTTLSQITALDPPPAPTASSHEAYPTLIIWNWNPVAGAQGYKWGTTNDYGSAVEMGPGTSKIETGLVCNTNYTRYVWAYNACGVSSAAALVQTSAVDPPQSPGAGTHVPSPSQIVWNWFAVTGATGYRWNTTNDYNTSQDMGTALSKTETDLNCNSNYTRFIWSYSACGHSAAVSLVQTTSLNPPAAPTAATHVPSPTQVIWNWNTVSGATGYKWNTTNNLSGATEMGNVTTKTETGLTCNTSYTRYVWAYSSCGTSTPASLTQTTSLNPPTPPTAATHVATPVQIVWNWNTVSGATGYMWNTTNTLTGAQDMGTSTSKTETGLNCNTAYTRYVWAYSNCGTSTSTALAKTTTIETPASPAAGTHTASNTQVVWNWNAVTGATGYKWNTSNDYATATDMGTATSKTENSLSCGTAYTRYVWAYNNCANSVSAALTKTTTSTPPSAPVAGTAVPSGAQIVWNWNTVTGATGYKWSTTNDYATATDVGNVWTWTETGLNCSTAYTCYIWAYNGCANSTSTSMSSTTTASPPAAPTAGTNSATASQIVWNWTVVADAAGYKWNTVNIYSSAIDMGSVTSKTESGLACSTVYTRFVWAYSNCGVSTSVPLTETTSSDQPASPTAGTHVATPEQITWNWNTVTGAVGYKWSTTNDFATAIDMGTATSRTETGLNCGTSYTRYVWAYHGCGNSTSTTLTQTSGACFVCGTTLYINHVAGNVAPVTKSTSYGTVNNVPGAETKCWITSNLGSDHQATAVSDATEASAGWYWQFNRMQGYKHDGTARTPSTTWITTIDEYANWATANDPCALELGTGWRLPTSTEYTQVDASGGWNTWNGPWNSLLKMHAAGGINYLTGNLESRGTKGYYWSGTQSSYNYMGQDINFAYNSCSVSMHQKAFAFTIRCLKD
jgi:hypothetical protein